MDSEDFQIAKESFLNNKSLTKDLHDYYTENWERCEKMWVKYHRQGLPKFLSETNNPVEIIH